MIDVIIADDEYIIRERLKKNIQWSELGYNVVGDCENGLQAIEIIESKKPRVAILDINMPILSGLELAEHISKNYLNVYIIILTGYADFDYARQALESGVFRYMLKPVNKSELTNALLELKEIIASDDKKLQEDFSKAHKLELAQKKISLHNLLEFFENPSSDIPLNIFDSINTIQSGISYECMSAIISIDGSNKVDEYLKDKNLWLFCLENILTELAGEKYEVICVNDLKGHLIACLFGISLSDNNQVNGLFNNFISSVKKIMPFGVTVGMGKITGDISTLNESYKSAKFSFARRLIDGKGKIISCFESEPDFDNVEGIEFGLLNDMVISSRTGDFERLQKILTDSFSALQSVDNWYSTLHNLVSMTMIVTEIICNENDINYKTVWVPGITSVDIISESESSSELLVFLLNKFKLLIHLKNSQNRKSVSETISRIIDYIDSNFRNPDLGLRNICMSIPSNASYISNQFKKETGININTYITNKRMQEAQKLKSQNNMSVEEMAFYVGYTDQYYFSRCYKKYFGVTPSTKIFKNPQK